jgi:hypothetical protein
MQVNVVSKNLIETNVHRLYSAIKDLGTGINEAMPCGWETLDSALLSAAPFFQDAGTKLNGVVDFVQLGE